MDEISIVIQQFSSRLQEAIDAEVRRQVSSVAAHELPTEDQPISKRKPYAKSAPKPCPVTGILNTHRRFSYLMPEARTAENLERYRKGKR